MKVTIEVIPHTEQRYDTAGDWQFLPAGYSLLVMAGEKELHELPNAPQETLRVRVSDTGDFRSNMLIAFHELGEAVLCRVHGIDEKAVDDWDMNYQGPFDEPGEDPKAPYHPFHMVMDIQERTLAAAMKVAWPEHEQRIAALKWRDPEK